MLTRKILPSVPITIPTMMIYYLIAYIRTNTEPSYKDALSLNLTPSKIFQGSLYGPSRQESHENIDFVSTEQPSEILMRAFDSYTRFVVIMVIIHSIIQILMRAVKILMISYKKKKFLLYEQTHGSSENTTETISHATRDSQSSKELLLKRVGNYIVLLAILYSLLYCL